MRLSGSAARISTTMAWLRVSSRLGTGLLGPSSTCDAGSAVSSDTESLPMMCVAMLRAADVAGGGLARPRAFLAAGGVNCEMADAGWSDRSGGVDVTSSACCRVGKR